MRPTGPRAPSFDEPGSAGLAEARAASRLRRRSGGYGAAKARPKPLRTSASSVEPRGGGPGRPGGVAARKLGPNVTRARLSVPFDRAAAATFLAALAATFPGACARVDALPSRPPEVRLKPREEVVLDGSGSFDPEGEELTYRWRQVAGPEVELRDAETPWPRFTPTGPGRYEFELTVAAPPGGGAGLPLEGEPVRLAVDVLAPNRAPKVELVPLLRAEPGQWVALDGGGATDPDGDVLSFRWELVGGEVEGFTGPLVTLVDMDPPGGRARLVRARGWRAGEYRFRLTAKDPFGAEASGETVLRVAPNDLPPAAVPRIKGGALGEGDLARGHFALRLGAWPHPDGGVNEPPVAKAAAGSPDDAGDCVLDGSASSDPNGDELEFRWTQSGGPPIRVLRPAGPPGAGEGVRGLARLAFTPPGPGLYAFRLVVSDGVLESAPAEVEVVVPGPAGRGPAPPPRGEAAAAPPGAAEAATDPGAPGRPARRTSTAGKTLVADAGADATVETGEEVALDGRRSRGPRGAGLAYGWRQVAGPRVTSFRLSPAEGDARPRFTPEEAGQYEFELRVSTDHVRWSEPDRVRVTVVGANRPPWVEAPSRIVAREGEAVRVAASWGDPDGDPASVEWRPVGRRRARLRQEGGVAELVAPEGGCALQAVVRDSRGAEARTIVNVRVPGEGRSPVAIARARGDIRPGGRVVLDGRESYDLEGKPLRWRWALAGTTLVALDGSESPLAGFRAPAAGNYEFDLTVSAGGRESSPARVVVEVSEPSLAGEDAIVLAPVPARVTAGRRLVLDASGTRSGPGRPGVTWTQVAGPRVREGPAEFAAGRPVESARLVIRPEKPGEYRFRAEADAPGVEPREVRFEVARANARPVASARATVAKGGRVVLDGSPSRDPEGAPLLHRWVEVGGEGLGLGGRPTRARRLVVDNAPRGRHAVRLVVTDGERVARSRVVEFEVSAPGGP